MRILNKSNVYALFRFHWGQQNSTFIAFNNREIAKYHSQRFMPFYLIYRFPNHSCCHTSTCDPNFVWTMKLLKKPNTVTRKLRKISLFNKISQKKLAFKCLTNEQQKNIIVAPEPLAKRITEIQRNFITWPRLHSSLTTFQRYSFHQVACLINVTKQFYPTDFFETF